MERTGVGAERSSLQLVSPHSSRGPASFHASSAASAREITTPGEKWRNGRLHGRSPVGWRGHWGLANCRSSSGRDSEITTSNGSVIGSLSFHCSLWSSCYSFVQCACSVADPCLELALSRSGRPSTSHAGGPRIVPRSSHISDLTLSYLLCNLYTAGCT